MASKPPPEPLFSIREANTKFDIEWRGQRVALKAGNGKYVCTKKNGQLSAVSDTVGKLTLIQNRLFSTEASPLLISRLTSGLGGDVSLGFCRR